MNWLEITVFDADRKVSLTSRLYDVIFYIVCLYIFKFAKYFFQIHYLITGFFIVPYKIQYNTVQKHKLK